MLDLAARVHYKVHFDIVKRFPDVSLFEEVIFTIYNWLHWKYKDKVTGWNWQQFRRYGDFRTEDYIVYAKTTSFTGKESFYNWACKIEEYEPSQPDEDEDLSIGKAPRIWTTEIGFQQVAFDRATISYVVYYTDRAGFIGIIDNCPNPTLPGFVRNLLFSKKLDCMNGTDKLLIHEIELKPGAGKPFAERVMNNDRTVPYILIVPDEDDDHSLVFPVDAKQVARNVAGNAIVYTIDSIAVLDEITYFIDKKLHARKGQIMVYWPKSISSDKKCRYLSASQVNTLSEDMVIGILRRVFSTDIRYSDSREMFRIEDCDELYRQQRNTELRTRIAEIKATADQKELSNTEIKEQLKDTEELLLLADEDIASKQDMIDTFKEQLEEAKQDNWKLQGRITYLDSFQEEARGVKASLDALRSFPNYPQSPSEIADFFRKVFQEKLDFTERGLRSLQTCETRADILWGCFYSIATTLRDLYKDGTPNIEQAFQTATGWNMARGEGTQTRKDNKLMNLRKDVYEGREILIEPHVRNGNRESAPDFVRIYFCYDNVTQKIIIGHVGKHLDNFSSQSI